MAVNWGMAGGAQQNALAMFQMGNQLGQQARERQDKAKFKEALGTIYGAGEQTAGAPVTVGANAPGGGIGGGQAGVGPQAAPQADPKAAAWNALLQYSDDPRIVMQLRHQQQQQQADQRKVQNEGMVTVGKMLRAAKADPAKYGMIRQAAAQNGIDISRVPETYDPAWVDQQLMFVDAVDKDGGAQISGIRRELEDAGYTGEALQQALISVINNKYATEYVDEAGNTRRRTTLSLAPPPMGGTKPPPQKEPGAILQDAKARGAITAEEAQTITQSLGPNGQAEFAKWKADNGIRVISRTGTAPDGRRVVQYDDGTIEYGN